MAETDTWTPADDDYVREALTSLRTDVEALPLADVRFVKARGRARRRRTMLGWTAGAAAAALVAAVIGFSALGGDNTTAPVPPATKTSAAPTTPVDRQAVSPYLAEPGALPLGKEWKLALGWSSDFTVETTTNAEADLCWPFNGTAATYVKDVVPVEDQNLLSATGNIQGRQSRWVASREPMKLADALAKGIGRCKQGQFAVRGVQTTGWPRLYSYTAGDAGSGWYAVTTAGNEVAVLNIVEPDHPKTTFERAEVERLAAIATARLEQHGDGTPSTMAPPSPATTSGEDMPVVGSEPALQSSLFVPASRWSSPELTQGARTYAGPGSQEGSASIAQCETDQFQAGAGGRYGIVSIRSGSGQANYIGKQRVRLDDSTSSAQQQAFVQARLAEAKALYGRGCTFGNRTVKATPGPTDGTWRLDTVFKDGSPTFTEWVGVTAQDTPGAMTTIVLTKVPNPKMGFPELDRLLLLARQR
jgi:hypothetical protein